MDQVYKFFFQVFFRQLLIGFWITGFVLYCWLNNVPLAFEFFLGLFCCIYIGLSAIITTYKNSQLLKILICKVLFFYFSIIYCYFHILDFWFANVYWFRLGDFFFNNYIFTSLSTNILKVILIIFLLAAANSFLTFLFRFRLFFSSITEFPFLVMGCFFFLFILLISADFFLIYISLVGLGICVYALLALHCNFGPLSRESTLKYFILSVFSTGLFLGGIALLFLNFGSLNFAIINQLLFVFFCNSLFLVDPVLTLKLGLILIFFSFLFKLSAAPVHFWAPEVYSGSSYSILFIIILPIKFIIALLFLKIFKIIFFINGLSFTFNYTMWVELSNILFFVILGSVFIGGINAIYEQKIKRFFAYSSINQIGFLLTGLFGFKGSVLGLQVFLFFLLVYCLNMFGFFVLLFFFSQTWRLTQSQTMYSISRPIFIFFHDLKDLFLFKCYVVNFSGFKSSQSAFVQTNYFYHIQLCYSFFIICLLFSLAGIPPFIGFFSKFFIIFYCLKIQAWFIVGYLLVFSAISAFYYSKIVKILFFEPCKSSVIQSFFIYTSNYSYTLLIIYLILFIVIVFLICFSFICLQWVWISLQFLSINLLFI